MTNRDLAAATASVYELLAPFAAEERVRIVRATFALLGQADVAIHIAPPPGNRFATGSSPLVGTPDVLSTKASRWAQQFAITRAMLDEAFLLESTPAEFVGVVPGATAQEKTVNSYLLAGLATFLKTGEPEFADALARSLCENAGCFDPTNHSKRVKHLGTRVVGNKLKGWKILAPGLKEAAELVRTLKPTLNSDRATEKRAT